MVTSRPLKGRARAGNLVAARLEFNRYFGAAGERPAGLIARAGAGSR